MKNNKQLTHLNEYASDLINNVLSVELYAYTKQAYKNGYYSDTANKAIIKINKHAVALKKANDWNDAQKEINSIGSLCCILWDDITR